MNYKTKRKYNMSVRKKKAEATEKDILRATGELWIDHPIRDITLEMIAHKAGVTERTILRKFGSKDELYEAAIQHDVAGIQSIKDQAEPGNIENAIQTLMKEYTLTGLAAIRTLAVEFEFPIAAKILKKGRDSHKAWCERVFSPFLPPNTHYKYALYIGAIYAATDVNKWKLLHKDLGYSEKETASIFIITLESIIHNMKQDL